MKDKLEPCDCVSNTSMAHMHKTVNLFMIESELLQRVVTHSLIELNNNNARDRLVLVETLVQFLKCILTLLFKVKMLLILTLLLFGSTCVLQH